MGSPVKADASTVEGASCLSDSVDPSTMVDQSTVDQSTVDQSTVDQSTVSSGWSSFYSNQTREKRKKKKKKKRWHGRLSRSFGSSRLSRWSHASDDTRKQRNNFSQRRCEPSEASVESESYAPTAFSAKDIPPRSPRKAGDAMSLGSATAAAEDFIFQCLDRDEEDDAATAIDVADDALQCIANAMGAHRDDDPRDPTALPYAGDDDPVTAIDVVDDAYHCITDVMSVHSDCDGSGGGSLTHGLNLGTKEPTVLPLSLVEERAALTAALSSEDADNGGNGGGSTKEAEAGPVDFSSPSSSPALVDGGGFLSSCTRLCIADAVIASSWDPDAPLVLLNEKRKRGDCRAVPPETTAAAAIPATVVNLRSPPVTATADGDDNKSKNTETKLDVMVTWQSRTNGRFSAPVTLPRSVPFDESIEATDVNVSDLRGARVQQAAKA